MFVNLLDNALKYTPLGGRVTITGEARSEEIVVAVQDTGPSIPPEDAIRIWERLYRGDKSRSQRGLGLGLSLVRAIVTSHGGRGQHEPHRHPRHPDQRPTDAKRSAAGVGEDERVDRGAEEADSVKP